MPASLKYKVVKNQLHIDSLNALINDDCAVSHKSFITKLYKRSKVKTLLGHLLS